MPGWVEIDARREALIIRDAPVVWRNLKAALYEAVIDYRKYYPSPDGTIDIVVLSPDVNNENVFCVWLDPSYGSSIRLLFDRNRTISWQSGTLTVCLSETGDFEFEAQAFDPNSLQLKSIGRLNMEAASRRILEPAIARLPRRPSQFPL